METVKREASSISTSMAMRGNEIAEQTACQKKIRASADGIIECYGMDECTESIAVPGMYYESMCNIAEAADGALPLIDDDERLQVKQAHAS